MHFDFLPKVTHNEDAIREYERQEDLHIRRWIRRLALGLPLIILFGWLYFRFR